MGSFDWKTKGLWIVCYEIKKYFRWYLLKTDKTLRKTKSWKISLEGKRLRKIKSIEIKRMVWDY